jgi:hypothetical protein
MVYFSSNLWQQAKIKKMIKQGQKQQIIIYFAAQKDFFIKPWLTVRESYFFVYCN